MAHKIVIFFSLFVSVSAAPYDFARRSGFSDFGQSCLRVNATVCDGTNAGACREDCNPEPDATEAECRAKGCCWQESYDQYGQIDKKLPWCFFPSGSPQCMLGQIAKDADPAVKAAARAYHRDGTEASVQAYRKACLARGDWFYSFFVTPLLWFYDDNGLGSWQSSRVTLVKYGCNSKACTDADIAHVVHRMSAPQNEMSFSWGSHASLKFNVTGFSAQKSPYEYGEEEESHIGILVAITIMGAMLLVLTAVAFHWYRKYSADKAQIDLGSGKESVYHKNSFSQADSLVNSQM